MKLFFKLILIFIFSFGILNISQAEDKYNPVVKVESYKNIYGKYIQKTGWGSASVISKEGHILTNNHVVDDGAGNISDYFSICLTYDENEKPDCDYTATLIERNKDMDVALLKINKKDIYGNLVDFSEFQMLSIDFEYEIKSQDEVLAIGYPSIGAETITKTKGIVSGSVDYNSYKYIKSDTLIAGGNSGGALLSKDGKLIGIPTFLIGGLFDPNIGYSVSVKEIKSFLDENIIKNITEEADLENFIKNKNKIDKINNDLEVNNKLLNFKFPEDYEITNYADSKLFILEPKLENKNLITSLSIGLMEIPKIDNDDDFLYFLEKIGVYYEGYYKFKKVDIGGVEFLYLVVIGDSTAGESMPYAFYLSKISDDKLMIIQALKPITSDVDKNKIVNKNLEDLIGKIEINKENVSNIDFGFNILSPKLSVKKVDGLVSNEIEGTFDLYFGNLYDVFSLSVNELESRDGKGKDIEEIYKNETIDIEDDFKSMIKLKGHKGFIYCDNYDYYVEDENGGELKQNTCTIQIYEGIKGSNDKDYYIVGELRTNKHNIEDDLEKVLDLFRNDVSIPEIGDGETNLVNLYKNLISFSFEDLIYQSDNYKNAIKKLVKYSIIKDSKKFDGDKAMKWKEFIVYYFKSLYNYKFDTDNNCEGDGEYSCLFKNNFLIIDGKKVSMFDVFVQNKIPLDEYVDYDKSNIFMTHMELLLSGAKKDKLTQKWYSRFIYLGEDSIFQDEKSKIDKFRNDIYGKENVYIGELLSGYGFYSYFQENNVYYIVSENKIVLLPIYDNKEFNYSSKLNIENDKYRELCEVKNDDDCYQIMTKSLMIDLLLPEIDFTLFDESLKNNKKSVID